MFDSQTNLSIGNLETGQKVQYNSKTGYICSDYLKEESTSTSTIYVTPDAAH